MNEKQMDEIAQSALLLFPLLKHLFNGNSNDPVLLPLRNQTYQILWMLQKNGPLQVSAIGKRLIIAKQNMTTLVDRLEAGGWVERKADPKDRRAINIFITPKGSDLLKQSMAGLKEVVKGNLVGFDEADIQALYEAFKTTRAIAHKLLTDG